MYLFWFAKFISVQGRTFLCYSNVKQLMKLQNYLKVCWMNMFLCFLDNFTLNPINCSLSRIANGYWEKFKAFCGRDYGLLFRRWTWSKDDLIFVVRLFELISLMQNFQNLYRLPWPVITVLLLKKRKLCSGFLRYS